jgi:putative hemolysin
MPRAVSSSHGCDSPDPEMVSMQLGTAVANAILTTGMHGLPLLQVVAVAMLILANAFFVAAEFAMVSTRDTRIEQLLAAHVSGARAVRRLQHDLEYFLPAVQLGVTLCSLAIGWIGEPLAANVVLGWIDLLPQPPAHAQIFAHAAAIAAVAIGFAIITYLHVTIGELVPKSLALRRAEALAVAVAPSMLIFMRMARPAVRLLKVSAAVILRGFDIPMTERAAVHSPEELKLITTAARRLGLLPRFQETLIHRAIELDDVPVREIMTPRQRIFSLPSNMPIEEASAQVIEHMNSRVPVYDETLGPEHIIGIVYSKDLSRLMFFRPKSLQRPVVPQSAVDAAASRPANPQIGLPFMELRLRQVMREVLVVPETKSALALLREFQKRRRQMAIVVDEFGSTVGLVTAEDAIEQLTGELEDEFDDPARPVLANAQGTLVLEGGANLRDLETQMQWSLPRDGGVETIAGFMLTRLGHIPKAGETVDYEGRRLTVAEMEGRRIAKIHVDPIDTPGEPPESAAADSNQTVSS